MRADRLISILMLLQTRGHMTARDLAQHLEVSERTIYRDLDALCMAGIPLYTERGPGGGCSLLGGYQTRLTGLTEVEQRALFFALLAGSPSELGMEKAFDDAVLKVSAALPEHARANADFIRQRFHVDATWWHHNLRATPCLQRLQEAVWSDSVLFVHYYNEDGSRQACRIEPYGLVRKAGVWYLIGMCENKQHVLRVSRILHVENTTLSFTRPCDFDLAASWERYRTQLEANCPPYASALRLAPDEVHILPYVLNEWGDERHVEHDKPVSIHSLHPYPRSQQKKQNLYPRTAIKKRGSSLKKKANGLSKKTILFFYPSQKMTCFVAA